MIKLVIADCDGTILDDNKQIDKQLKNVIKQLKEKNIDFTLASGRNIFLMEEIVEDLEISVPYIINNGANICKMNKVIESYSIQGDIVSSILRNLENENFPFLAYSENSLISYSNHQLLDGFKTRLKDKLEFIEYNKKNDYKQMEFFKVAVATDNLEDILKVKSEIELLYKEVNFKRSEGYLFTITNNEATKGCALEKLVKYFGCDISEVLVFGDNYNDLSIFKKAGQSVAMKNSDDQIKKEATFTTLDNNHQGVSEFLIKYFDLSV